MILRVSPSVGALLRRAAQAAAASPAPAGSPTSSPVPRPSAAIPDPNRTRPGVIVGAVVGSVLGAFLIVFALFWWGRHGHGCARRRDRGKAETSADRGADAHDPHTPAGAHLSRASSRATAHNGDASAPKPMRSAHASRASLASVPASGVAARPSESASLVRTVRVPSASARSIRSEKRRTSVSSAPPTPCTLDGELHPSGYDHGLAPEWTHANGHAHPEEHPDAHAAGAALVLPHPEAAHSTTSLPLQSPSQPQPPSRPASRASQLSARLASVAGAAVAGARRPSASSIHGSLARLTGNGSKTDVAEGERHYTTTTERLRDRPFSTIYDGRSEDGSAADGDADRDRDRDAPYGTQLAVFPDMPVQDATHGRTTPSPSGTPSLPATPGMSTPRRRSPSKLDSPHSSYRPQSAQSAYYSTYSRTPASASPQSTHGGPTPPYATHTLHAGSQPDLRTVSVRERMLALSPGARPRRSDETERARHASSPERRGSPERSASPERREYHYTLAHERERE